MITATRNSQLANYEGVGRKSGGKALLRVTSRILEKKRLGCCVRATLRSDIFGLKILESDDGARSFIMHLFRSILSSFECLLKMKTLFDHFIRFLHLTDISSPVKSTVESMGAVGSLLYM